jgi:hypothetical protein
VSDETCKSIMPRTAMSSTAIVGNKIHVVRKGAMSCITNDSVPVSGSHKDNEGGEHVPYAKHTPWPPTVHSQ